ncbi:MAG: type II toxin-antitoxin system VapC family toxin [Gammaproteobacteria bacterium]|nr:type II toxin-antitoxin system VapC family toxin [Gammaproteobacteria bacterium]MCH9743620.1 type II toxin-antitoxin system VapC family toxin [Gammaproteobacteria bacterium]
MSYLLDTNILSELVKKTPNTHVTHWVQSVPDDQLHISALTLGEIRKGVEKVQSKAKQEKLRLWLEHELAGWFEERILPINIGIADRWGRLQAEENRPLPAIDSLLAATALHHDFIFVTRNVQDFQYTTLKVVNPWEAMS